MSPRMVRSDAERMPGMKGRPMTVHGLVAAGLLLAAAGRAQDPLAWPALTRECRPWTYNWWPGSAVDRDHLARELRRYRDAGLGGIHIVPIYGAKGAEARYLDHLSPAWMEMLKFAVDEADRLDLGVDLTTGTGWCFGGPHIPPERGGWTFDVKVFDARPGAPFAPALRRDALRGLQAVGADGAVTDLLPRVDARGRLDWTPPAGGAKVIALHASPAKAPAVKRAAPGGEGLMLNPFDPDAMRAHLGPFTRAFPADGAGPKPRAMYHDSYEYFGVAWSPAVPDAFARRRGYRLADELAAFAGMGDPDRIARVQADYRETLSDLMVEEVFPEWTGWCRARGIRTRNQAHGAPANLLDLYALADIPETEMFGHGGRDPRVSRFDADFGGADRNPLISKLASSAAHVKGTRLVSAEFGTWVAEHFHETPEELKCLADLLFVSGVNHVFYHGTCYSPDDAAWPGWLFYAATQMNPRNPVWRDAPLLNAYLARTQAVLQSGTPANDILLYWPIHDLWHGRGEPVRQLRVHDAAWMNGQPVGRIAADLWRQRIGFDFVSDRLLANVRAEGGRLVTADGAGYRAVVVPPCRLMPPETLERLHALATAGASVVFCERLPDDVPGWGDLEARRAQFRATRAHLAPRAANAPGPARAEVGRGAVYVGALEEALAACGIARELADAPEGVRFIRRRHAEGYHYLVVNHDLTPLDGWVRLAVPAAAVVVMDARDGATGRAEMRAEAGGTAVRLHVPPAGSLLLRTFDTRPVEGPLFRFARPGPVVQDLPGPWTVEFVAGGPVLPAPYETPAPGSWTANGDPETVRFAGTAVYRTVFDAPAAMAAGRPVVLDLGRVEVSARVRLNGAPAGHAWMTPYRVLLPGGLKPGRNELEVEVTNLAANRIRDLDRRGVPWRIFRDINFVDIRYKAFDARGWPVRDSGLFGPVRLLTCDP